MELETTRLFLRAWRPDDLAPFAAQNADPRVMAYFERTLTLAESAAAIGRYTGCLARDGFGMLALERKADGVFIGVAGIQRILYEAPFAPAVEIGWRLSPGALGAGLCHGSGAFGFGAWVCTPWIAGDNRPCGSGECEIVGGDGAHRHDAGP